MFTESERETERLFDERARRMVHNEVMGCESSLISILASGFGVVERGELADLCEQAFELAAPVPDYESAAGEAGFRRSAAPAWWWNPGNHASIASAYDKGCVYNTAQSACEENGIEPYDREVYEHWAVSGWLADQLIAHGEKVDKDFASKCVWARTTTGQAIYGDYVIRRIVESLYRDDFPKPE